MILEWICRERVFLVRDNHWTMPIDMVSFAVSTGLGVSVVAGIISGVCYVLAYGATPKKSNRKGKSNLYCDVCGEYFRSIDYILGGDSSVTCTKCQKKICQKRCASPNQQQNGWICKNCLRPPESWFQGILYAVQSKKDNSPETMDATEDKGFDEIQKTRVQVQDFIEKLINSMLGQNVDDADVTKLYNDEHYLPLTGQQSPCTAHAALKQLIEKILKEVLNLPQLQQPLKGTPIPPDLNNGTYEELLATAILNKAISNSQNPRPSSSAASVSSRISNISHAKEEKEYFFGDETLDNKWRHQDIETTSISSLEDWLQSDSSFGSKKYVDRVTLTIKQDIEELSHASESDEDDEDDDSEYFRTKSSLWDDDEPNWFLQKRTFQGTHSPVPVPMLVPNPTTEAKVLIGDQEVDDTSDLSDVGSDYGDTEIVPTRHNLLVNSKTVIGGKNPLINGGVEGESESESSADSGVKEVDRGQSVYDDSEFTDRADGGSQGGYEPPPTFVSRADISIDDDNIEDASLMSVYSNTEQEAEYTERYASLPRTIEKKPDPPIRLSLQKNKPDVSNNEIERNEATEEKEDEEVKIVQMHFSGNYSKREKEKWKNAIEMKNNPYSKENIERRIKRSSSGAGSLFGSDYYAKLASSPSGTKSRSLEAKGLSWPPQSPPSDEEESITTEATTITIDGITTVPDKSESKAYVAAEEDKDVFRAVRMIIDVYGDNEVVVSDIPATEVEASPAKPLENIPELTSLTSDSDLSYVHVYNVENAKISKKSNKLEEGEPKPESVMKERNGNVETYPSTPQRQFSSPADSHKFIKSANASTRRPVVSTQRLKRHKSETDLLVDDSFYTVPKPLGMKKDNTLISKIYLDPQVRNFALINRRQLPVNPVVPTFRSQFSNSAESTSEQKAYYSDDGVGLSREKKFTVYRSIEDLYNNSTTIDVKNGTMVQTAQMFLSSEDDQYSERSSVYTDQRIRQNYSSSEDLSIDELETPKKKDNTLISKIYQQPTVRNYALANRYTIPAQESKALEKSASSEDEVFSDISRVPKIGSPKDISEVETQLEAMEVKEKETRKVSIENENDPGVETIAKRKIVHNLVGKFSGSQTHLEKWENKDDVHEENISISVKDLRKMFEKKQGKNNVVSSLTARSVSKQLKEELRN